MEKHINKWLERGLISDVQAEEMLNDIKDTKANIQRKRTLILLYSLGALLVGLGVITFIASNDWIVELFMNSPLLRIISLSAVTVAFYVLGYKFAYEKKSHVLMGKAFVFLSTILIGATYALIGQVYNTEAHASVFFLMWLLSVLPVAYLFNLIAVNLLSMALFAVWYISYYGEWVFSLYSDEPFVLLPALFGAFFYMLGNISFIKECYFAFSMSYKVIGMQAISLSMIIFIVIDNFGTMELVEAKMIAHHFIAIALVSAVSYFFNNVKDTVTKLEHIYVIMFAIYCSSIISFELNSILMLLIAHALIIATVVGAFKFAHIYESIKLLDVASSLLTLYIAVTYVRLSWSFMDKTLFFIIGGVILFVIAKFLERQRKQLKSKHKESEQTA